MRKYLYKRYFNMIEVVLAMGVIALAMTSVLALLPVGLNASRDAVGLNYSADAASDIVNRMKSWAESYSSDLRYRQIFTDSSSSYYLPDDLPSSPYTTINTVSKEFYDFLISGQLSDVDEDGSVTLPTKISIVTNGIFRHSDLKTVFFVLQGQMVSKDIVIDSVTVKRDFPVWIKNDSGGGKPAVDFAGMIYLWRSTPVTTVQTSGSWTVWPPSTVDTYDYFTGLNVEVSWPLALGYKERERCYYYTEVRKPQ